MSLLENLRNKSETYRHAVAISAALVTTLVIFFVWMSVLFPNVTGKNVAVNNTESKNPPLNVFKSNVAQSFAAIKDQWNTLTHTLSSTNYQADSNNQVQILSPEDAGQTGQNRAY